MAEKNYLEEIKPLMEAATESLIGCPVRIYFRASLKEDRQGEVFKDEDGMPAMELVPVEDIEKLYKNFLHECAHIIFHAKDLEARSIPAEIVALQEKGIQVLPSFTAEEYAEYWNSPKEIEARGFADYFYGFSKQKAKYFYNEDDVKTCLKVCANTTIQKG